jgi:hypothetical protein
MNSLSLHMYICMKLGLLYFQNKKFLEPQKKDKIFFHLKEIVIRWQKNPYYEGLHNL